jgi:aminobutyraldehyde dehydrogenase
MTVSEASRTFTIQRGNNSPLVASSDLLAAELFIDGEFRPASRTTDVVDPSNETTIAQVASGTVEEVDQAVAAAVRARRPWGRRTPKERAEILLAIADRLEENRELLSRLESPESR